MITAVGPRQFFTARNLAHFSEVDHRSAQDIALMEEACSGCTAGQYTPPGLLDAGDI